MVLVYMPLIFARPMRSSRICSLQARSHQTCGGRSLRNKSLVPLMNTWNVRNASITRILWRSECLSIKSRRRTCFCPLRLNWRLSSHHSNDNHVWAITVTLQEYGQSEAPTSNGGSTELCAADCQWSHNGPWRERWTWWCRTWWSRRPEQRLRWQAGNNKDPYW